MEFTLEDISKRLSLDIIDKCFKAKTKSKDCVESVSVEIAAPTGEGLISRVYRLYVTGSTHKARFVAKGLASDPLLRRTLRCNKFFAREILFFSEILPLLKKVQKALGAEEDIQRNIPICYAYHSGNDEDYLILEDLSESSCASVADPKKNERDSVLQLLAHMHAVSTALRVHKPDVFAKLVEQLKEEVYYNKDNHEWFSTYLQNAIEIDRQTLSEYEPENSVYYKKFLDLMNCDPYVQILDLLSYKGDHPTISHGDAWFSNFMFSKERVVLIDFQIVRCVSLVADVAYYLALCSNLCPTKEDYYEALSTYYSYFEFYLADMGLKVAKIMSREEFDSELKKYGRYGILAALSTIALMASSEKCDLGLSFSEFSDVDRIPLDKLWPLSPMTDPEHKMRLVNAFRVAVDVGLI